MVLTAHTRRLSPDKAPLASGGSRFFARVRDTRRDRRTDSCTAIDNPVFLGALTSVEISVIGDAPIGMSPLPARTAPAEDPPVQIHLRTRDRDDAWPADGESTARCAKGCSFARCDLA